MKGKPQKCFFGSILHYVLAISLVTNLVFIVHEYRRSVVVSVPDGDSLQLADGRRIRLLGIDAPEKGRCMAEEARAFLERTAKGKHVRLKDTVNDNYGRVLANVFIEQPDAWTASLLWRYWQRRGTMLDQSSFPDPFINNTMVSHGFARFESVKSPYSDTLKSSQTMAREVNNGIWSQECRSGPPSGDCMIKGNLREGKKTYYLPSCRYYDQVVIDESFGDAWFCSEGEASTSGFTNGCPGK